MDAELEVLRCTDCVKLVFNRDMRKLGCCPNCGCKRFKNVLLLKDPEIEWLKEKGVSPEFMSLFEVTDG